ncbi:3-dehydroquinate dehydratase [uncultured archaeon]|nr:3-dehydroquinate dehydratase [uncultured archaeon]HKJ96207.1 ABC transporter ATP-binding protein [Thermoplasmataceae archaeon]
MEASISVRGLYKKYVDNYALNDLNLDVEPGKIFGVLGPNGSGKTTLLKIISALLERTSGSVSVRGLDPSKHKDQVKKLVGYVPEVPTMYESLSPGEFFSFVATVRNIEESLVEERINSMVRALGISDSIDSFIGSLSFGTRQKVAIIASLLHDPEIIVMDEGMNGLDPRSAKILKELMRSFAERGKTVIFSTHIMDVAESVCDTVAILYKGRIVSTGTMDKLKERSGKSSSNLEEIFLKLTGNEDLDPLIHSLKESFRS